MARFLFLSVAAALAGAAPCAAARPELALQVGHTGRICTAAFSADGKWVLTASGDGSASLWDSATGKRLRGYRGRASILFAAALRADGRRILASDGGDHAYLWDTQTGKLLRTYEGDGDFGSAVGFSKDGRLILTAHTSRTLLRDAETGQTVREVPGGRGQFSPDDRYVLTQGVESALYDAATGKRLRTFADYALFSPDGTRVATRAYERKVTAVWEAQTGAKVREFPNGHLAHAISPDNKRLVTDSKGPTAVVWDIATGEVALRLEGHGAVTTAAAFSPDGRRLVTGDDDGGALIWDAATGRRLVTLSGTSARVSAQAVSPDGRRLAVGFGDRTVGVWDMAEGTRVLAPPPLADWVTCLSFSPDGKSLAVGQDLKAARAGGLATVIDLPTGEVVRTLELPGKAGGVQLTPDGQHLITLFGGFSGRERAAVWDVRTGAAVRKFEDADTRFLTGPGRTILAAGQQAPHPVRLLDAVKGDTLGRAAGGADFVNAWPIPDGARILTMHVGEKDVTTLKMIDLKTGEEAWSARGGKYRHEAGFSADGRRFLARGWDQVYLWDARAGRLERTVETGVYLDASALRPDGGMILTGDDTGVTRFWDAATGKELGRLLSLDGGKDWLVTTPEGLFDGSPGGRQKVFYRVGGGLDIVPVDRFFQDFHRPGLLARIWKGEALTPEVTLGEQKPPLLRLAPVPAAATDPEVTLTAEATDQGGGVRGPWLMHNGARLLAPGRAERAGSVVRRTFAVTLVPGANRLEVRAASADGSWESQPARVEVRFRRPVEKPRLHLIAVGVSKHAQGSFDLRFAADDARALAELFRSRGETLYQPVRPQVLTDDRATRANLQKALREAAGAARPADTLVVFLAGHGTLIERQYYFIPHEFRLRDNARLTDDVRKQGVALRDLTGWLTAVPALKRVLILDTCHAGAAVGAGGSRDPFAFHGTVERLSREQGLCTIAAAAAGEEAQESPELGHGVLSYALLAGLRGVERGPLRDTSVQPADAAGVADVLEWFSFAAGHTRRLSHKYFRREQQVKMSVEGDSFAILPLGP